MADAVAGLTERLGRAVGAGASLAAAVREIVRDVYAAHRRIVFHGDGYADAWQDEASGA